MNESIELTQTFLACSRQRLLHEMWPRLCSCLSGLTDEQIWWRPNEASNSVGNLLLHLDGNVRQWLLAGVGGIAYARDRDAEFREQGAIAGSELRSRLDATLREVDALLQKLTAPDLLRKQNIQVYRDVPAMDAIYHVVEHFAMHYGQILYISKLVRGEDLGFYAYLNQPSSAQGS